MARKLLDANAMLRFLINDVPNQAEKTSSVIYGGAFTIEAVLAEVVYVLGSVYKRERAQISAIPLDLLELIEIEHKSVAKYSLRLFSENSLDFVDCLLIAYNHISNVEIFSFDKKLNNKLHNL